MRCASLLLLLASAPADEASIVTAGNETVTVRELELESRGGALQATYVDAAGKKGSLQAADLVEIIFGRGGAPVPRPAIEDVELYLTTGDVLVGKLGPASGEGIQLQSAVYGNPLVKFGQLRGGILAANRPHLPKTHPKPATDDLVLTTTGDQAQGTVNAVSAAGVLYKSNALGEVTKPLKDVTSFWLVETEAAPKEPATLFAIVLTRDGSSLRGEIESLKEGVLTFKDLYGNRHKVARDAVSGLYMKNGRVVYLSDLQPAAVEEDANYIRAPKKSASDLDYPFQRDRSAKGTRLVLGGVEHRKGLGVRARSSLTFPLDGAFKRFQTTVGLDAASQGLGAIAAEVWVDARKVKELTFRGQEPPQALDLDVSGAKELRLVVTWAGHGQSDFADWASARLIR
jgi:hypothetical protein